MADGIEKVREIPGEVPDGATLEILWDNDNYFTHGFFKYPCKFIPPLPGWAVRRHTAPGDLVLDPFAGSGTTLVEAVLLGRDALGIDFDALSRLLCRVKTRPLSTAQLELIGRSRPSLLAPGGKKHGFVPDIHNLGHWFSDMAVRDLGTLRARIFELYERDGDEAVRDLLLVCFASIIRRCSYADDVSPKPYVSSRVPKQPADVRESFAKALDACTARLREYAGRGGFGSAWVVDSDARHIDAPGRDSTVALAVTSPPYINAFDYVRSLRLENAWLGFYGDRGIVEIKRRQVGTEYVPASDYGGGVAGLPALCPGLPPLLCEIERADRKRAYVVWKFFSDMRENFREVRRLLAGGGHYVVIIGESIIRGVAVPTHELLAEIAQGEGFRRTSSFSYVIKNRYLRIPRAGRGGFIARDHVIDLEKPHD